jgi:glutamate--cysteine ligase
LSDLGYTNSAQSELQIGFNSLNQYLEGLNEAIHSPSEEFAGLGVKVNGEYRQLNANVLQIENELYAPIRPKRVTLSNEKPSQALHRSGVEYIEVRSLDVNPFSPVGVNEKQIRFLDLFLTWCVLSESEEMDNCELKCWRDNWNKVILEGRTIGLELKIGCLGERLSLQDWAHRVFKELRQIAELMDKQHGSLDYQQVCDELETWIDQPELTISGQLLTKTKEHGGIVGIGMHLGQAYQQAHLNHQYQLYSDEIMEQEVSDSRDAQANIEADETQTFDEFLSDYFSYLKQQ